MRWYVEGRFRSRSIIIVSTAITVVTVITIVPEPAFTPTTILLKPISSEETTTVSPGTIIRDLLTSDRSRGIGSGTPLVIERERSV